MKKIPHMMVGSRTLLKLGKTTQEKRILARILKEEACNRQEYFLASQFRDIENNR